MGLVDLLNVLPAPVFLGLGAAATAITVRRRRRPPAYLAAAFTAIGMALLLSLVTPDQPGPGWVWVQTVAVACLAGYPWLLAAFAWSFGGPLPRALRLSGLVVVGLVVSFVPLAPFPDAGEPTTPGHALYLGVFVSSWASFSIAMATRLWRAGGRQRLIRARMRLMSAASLLLTVALFVAVMTPSDSATVTAATRGLALAAAVLFAAGFTPPAPLRMWWRRRASHEFQQMQAALIGAATPSETATAVAPLLADLVGGGVAVLEPSGDVVTAAGIDDDTLDALVRQWVTDRRFDDGLTAAIDIGERTLILRRTPYTPVFGTEERELIEGFALQMRLALERAELFHAAQQARQEAEEARQELESTLLGLAHDLKSPTLAISGFVGLLPHTEDPDERAEMIDHIQASSAYLRRLVDALVEVSRVGRARTSLEEVDLTAICAAVATRVRATHPDARVEVRGACPVVLMDPVRAEQMIDNLVANAVRHGGREDLTVTITCSVGIEGLRIDVADDGQGIDPADRERIFGLFQRGRTTASKGSGVGLGMVRRIVQAHEGTLTLAESPVGARFVIHLPPEALARPGPAPGSATDAGPPAPVGTDPTTPV
jgi:signal transduction histidine kinase